MRPHGTNASRDFGDTAMTYEFIQVDGYVDEQGNTGWNDCTVLDTFETTKGQLRRNFRKHLANVGFAFDCECSEATQSEKTQQETRR